MVRSVLALLVVATANTAGADAPLPRQASRNRDLQTLILPGAWSVMRRDQEREASIIRRDADEFMAKVKADRLLAYRTERDRAVASAVGAAVASQPFRPPERAASLSVGRESEVEIPQESPIVTEQTSKPGFISRAVDTARDVVSRAGDIAASVERRASRHSSPGGYYALVLIALFLVPSIGLAAILFGIVHIRHWSFFSGSVWVGVGCVMVWLAISGAKMLVPPLSVGNQPSVSLPKP